jgi:hypothetical protein
MNINIKIGNTERKALFSILDKLTNLDGKNIIEKFGRNKP